MIPLGGLRRPVDTKTDTLTQGDGGGQGGRTRRRRVQCAPCRISFFVGRANSKRVSVSGAEAFAIICSASPIALNVAYFLFVDESGQDRQESPCEVLAGVAIRDKTLWPFIQSIHKTEVECFGRRYSEGAHELKAAKLLKTKVFKLAGGGENFSSERERRDLAARALQNGAGAVSREYIALAQCKLEFVHRLLAVCDSFKCVLFACLVPKAAPRPEGRDFLRKDYAYLFERFFYFLEEKRESRGAGAIVFDELEKSRSHILVGQMDRYFKQTKKGRDRSELVIPEPFFVHSDLSTGVQIADIMAYLLGWGHYKADGAKSPERQELIEFASAAKKLAYRAPGKPLGITVINDLRPISEREK